jgi:hypothetical protein
VAVELVSAELVSVGAEQAVSAITEAALRRRA